LWAAIQEFADRHERNCLRRHARRGNLNGMRNFLDVLVTLCGLLWHYYKLQLVPEPWQGPKVIGRVCRYIELATVGVSDYPGYLVTLSENLKGDLERVRRTCAELHFAGHLRAALMLAQRARWEAPDGQPGSLLLECLPGPSKTLASALAKICEDRSRRPRFAWRSSNTTFQMQNGSSGSRLCSATPHPDFRRRSFLRSPDTAKNIVRRQ
jgi:hypothetical protein